MLRPSAALGSQVAEAQGVGGGRVAVVEEVEAADELVLLLQRVGSHHEGANGAENALVGSVIPRHGAGATPTIGAQGV